MSGSPPFQAEAWSVMDGDRYSLLRILITGGPSITVGTKQVLLDGALWDPLLGDTTTHAPGAFLTSDPAFGDLKGHISNGPLSAYSGQSLGRVLADNPISGCTVELWYLDDAITTLDPSTGAYRAFTGAIEDWELGSDGLHFSAIQRTNFNGAVTPVYVNRRTYPQSPDEAVDVAIPTLFGDCRAPGMRGPFTTPYPVEQRVGELMWGGRALLKGVLVDTGRGGTSKAKAVVASHLLKQVGIADPNLGPFGTSIFVEQDGKFDALVSGSSDIVNALTEAGITIADSAAAALKGITPTDIRIIPNYAEEPRAVLDPRETRWAILNQAASKRFLLGTLPTVSPPGIMTHIYAYIRYFTDAGWGGGHFQLAKGGGFSTFNNLVASTTPIYRFLDLGNAWGGSFTELPTTPWDFGQCELQVDVSGFASSANLYVIDMGLVVQYQPNQDLVSASKTVNETRHRPGFRFFGVNFPGFDYPDPHRVREVSPAVYEFKGKFYFNGMGWPDDGTATGHGSGAFTGTSLATIERPCDLAAFVIAKYGLESFPAAFEFSGGVGDFAAARALLQCADGSDMRLGFPVTDSQDVATTLAKIGEASASWVFLDESTDTWRFLPWRVGMPTTYGRRLNRNDLLGEDPITISPVPKSSLLTGLTIPYLWDEASETFLGTVSAAAGAAGAASRSCAGYQFSNIRDQDLAIRTDENDRFQVMMNNVLWTKQFAAGSGRDFVLAQAITSLNGVWSAAFGGYIQANCRLWADNSLNTQVQVTLTGGQFPSMAAMGASIQADLRVLDSRYNVLFNPSTGFTINRSGTTFRMNFLTGAGLAVNAAANLGFKVADYNTTSISSIAVPAFNCFTITCSLAFNILWRTGTFGLTGGSGLKNVAHLWGFEGHYDSGDGGTGTTIFGYTGLCPKGARETALETAAYRYFLKRDSTVEGRYIRDTRTALELRNRLIDLLTVQRIVVKFTTGTVVDLGRGEVVEITGDWDAYIPCPAEGSGGTWNGVRLVVVETQKRAGSTGWVADIVAVQI